MNLNQDNRAVSNVVATILLIGVVIVLVAGLSGQLQSFVQLIDTPVQAGVQCEGMEDQEDGTYDIEVLWSSSGNAETIYVRDPDGERPPLDGVGDKDVVEDLEERESIQVIGVSDDGSEVILRECTAGEV